METVQGYWTWDDGLCRNIFVTEDGRKFGCKYDYCDFSAKTITVRPSCDDGTIQGRLELLLDGMVTLLTP